MRLVNFFVLGYNGGADNLYLIWRTNDEKNIIFYTSNLFTLFYGWLALGGIGAIHPIVLVWLALFWIAGVLLSKTVFWGSLFGMLPAMNFIYMSTQETGQRIDIELPLGIIVLLFYLSCGYFVYKNRTSKPKQ